jgi:hypothetical protein
LTDQTREAMDGKVREWDARERGKTGDADRVED